METEATFTVDNDIKADWALAKIAEERAERDRLINIANERIAALQEQIEDLKKQCDNKTNYLTGLLSEYFTKVPHKETKTQETYKLLSGSLVLKKPSQKINHNDEMLMAYVDDKYIKIEKSIKWAEFKKNLDIINDKVVDIRTGEVVSGCTVEDVEGSFDIKLTQKE